MEEGLRKEVEKNFLQTFSIIKEILDKELSGLDGRDIDQGVKIVVEQQDLYEDWIENIETAPLPEIEAIEQIPHTDGTHLKIVYTLPTQEAKHIRKIKVKSNGKVDIHNYIITEREINNRIHPIKIEYDTYGNLIFIIE
ncbi:MAG: hypothetical protein GXO45_02790 [Aquificae bacterium]|nr:hypothetical protein [Aquificota bacterium]